MVICALFTRDGKRAIELAKKTVELTSENGKANSYVLTALAAAYAEVGDFDQAVKVQTEALAGASSEEKTEYESRLKLYEAGQPYRDVPKTESIVTATTAK